MGTARGGTRAVVTLNLLRRSEMVEEMVAVCLWCGKPKGAGSYGRLREASRGRLVHLWCKRWWKKAVRERLEEEELAARGGR